MLYARTQNDHVLCVAPMMAWTDRHCRFFHRLLAPRARLYTEMLTADALRFGDRAHLLAYNPEEHPVALQLGGADPGAMAEAARIGADAGFDEININVGCPSDRVQNGRFGACLMEEANQVADCVAAMRSVVDVPVTVKTRIGVDDRDDYGFLADFTSAVQQAGCDTLIVHARKAWLSGLSPKANREIPPLDYDRVRRIKRGFPDLPVVLNGGIGDAAEAVHQQAGLDGVMLGRAAYQQPYELAQAHSRLFRAPLPSRSELVNALRPYVEREYAGGTPIKAITRHILGLYRNCPGGRRWRQVLSERAHRSDAGPHLLDEALAVVNAAPAARAA